MSNVTPTNIDRIDANPINLGKLISEVKGFYIPEYQRPYTWSIDDVDRLFETIDNAIQAAITQPYFAFLGAILAIDDPMELEEVYHIKRDEAPATVYALVDGQQRVTTLVLFIAEIYKQLVDIKREISDNKIEIGEYGGKLNSAITEAKSALFVRNDWEPDSNVYLPKIINGQYDDIWLKSQSGHYQSPVALYLSELSRNDAAEISDESIKKLTVKMVELLDGFTSRGDIISRLADNNGVQERFLSRTLPKALVDTLRQPDSSNYRVVTRLLLLLVLLRFMLENIKFAQIRVNRESFAFDIFDSLNSTGDPLTAIETFKPLVIRTMTQVVYERSKEKEYFEKFTDYIEDENHDRKERHNLTKKFITSLALYENGNSVGESLNEQRRYLREYFLTNPSERQPFCEAISHLSEFYGEIWDNKDVSQLDNRISDEAKIGISILQKTGHTIVIPILARYYTEFILSGNEDYSSWNEVVRLITAFSLFWRLIHSSSTAGIDDIYRRVIATSTCRRVKLVSPGDLKLLLMAYLDEKSVSGKVFNRQDFVEYVSKAQYSTARNNSWLKFFILAAMHDAISDSASPGLEKKGANACNPTLTVNRWLKVADPLTIEHVAPQRPENPAKWDRDLLLPDYLHSIGNLTLLPKQKNIIAGNKDWPVKREIYGILSESDPVRRLKSIDSIAQKYDLTLTAKTKKILKEADFWIGVGSLTTVTKWDKSIVTARSKCLAGLAWDNLSSWLGY